MASWLEYQELELWLGHEYRGLGLKPHGMGSNPGLVTSQVLRLY